jgi:hypothetical protein
MLATDGRSEWDAHLLNDPRVTHLWDQHKVSGRFFATEYEHQPKSTQWDAYYLYEQGVSWDRGAENVLGSGRTVIGHSDELKAEIGPVLARS